jgi:hypothetical protein
MDLVFTDGFFDNDVPQHSTVPTGDEFLNKVG